MKALFLLLILSFLSLNFFAKCLGSFSVRPSEYKVFTGSADESHWTEDYARIEPCREADLLLNFLEWSTPKLGHPGAVCFLVDGDFFFCKRGTWA